MAIEFEPHTRVTWFSGEQFEEAATKQGHMKALSALRAALSRCFYQDMREDELTIAAVEYLKGSIQKPILADRFRQALDIQQPEIRFMETSKRLSALEREAFCQFSRTVKGF